MTRCRPSPSDETTDDPLKRYEKNEPLAYSFIKKYYPTLIGDEDYLQVVKMALWQACQQFDPSRNIKFSTFAYRVMRNKLLNELRRDKRSKRYGVINVSLEERLEVSAEFGDNEDFMDISDFTENSDLRADLKALLSKLTRRERYALVSLATDMNTLPDVAKTLGMKQAEVLEMVEAATAFLRKRGNY